MHDLQAVFEQLKGLLAKYQPPLVPVSISPTRYELQFDRPYQTRSERTGKVTQKHGLYFAGIVKQTSFVGLYFMPVYSHRAEFAGISNDLAKLLKGKSCFHVKNLDPDLIAAIADMLDKGFGLYNSSMALDIG